VIFQVLIINGCSVSRTSSAYFYSAKVESGGDSEENSLNCLDREFHKFFMVNASFHHMAMLLVIPPFHHSSIPKTIPQHRMLVLHREFSNLSISRISTGALYVAYAERDNATNGEIAGAGKGFVDKFAFNRIFIERVASNGELNAPWGLAIAPPSFGPTAVDLLVGNFGDG
jgi:hypothetical protein